MIKICQFCESEFKTNEKNKKYCKQECYFNSKKQIKIFIKCKVCNKDFEVAKSASHKYSTCSKECSKVYHDKLRQERSENSRVVYICKYCNKEYFVLLSVHKHPERNSAFCSMKCRNLWESENKTGENHHNWSRVLVNCNYCNKEFFVKNYMKDNKNKFCSIPCRQNWWKENIITDENFIIKKRLGNINFLTNHSHRKTNIEKIIEDELIRMDLNYIYQYNVNNKFAVDFFLPDYNIIIEALGDYWHANPNKYGSNKEKTKLNEMQIKQIKKDKARFAYFDKCNFIVFKIWEYDILKDTKLALNPLFDYIANIKSHKRIRND